MANGHRVPGVKDAIWSGYAVGVREESCVRGYIDTVTFVFEDGTIFTDSRNKTTSVSKTTKVTESLAYLTDPGGNQCIKGTLVSNASSYLRDRSVAAFAEAMAAGYASAQTTVDRASSGSLSAYVDGDVIKYGLGRGLSGSAAEVATYLRQRQENAFDVIYFPSDKTLQIMVEQQIEIDYDPAGRKVNYHYSQVTSNEKTLCLISLLLVTGCVSNHTSVLPTEARTTAEIMTSHVNGDAVTSNYRISRELHVPAHSGVSSSSSQIEDLNRDFQRVINPDIIGFVYAHRAGDTPVPGYTTIFKLYDKEHYALNHDGYLQPRQQ